MFISVLYIFLKKKMLQAMFERFFQGKEATLHNEINQTHPWKYPPT